MHGYSLESVLPTAAYYALCRGASAAVFTVVGITGSAYAQGDTVIPGIPPEVNFILREFGFPGVLLLLGWWFRGIATTYAAKLPDMHSGIPVIVRLSDEDRALLEQLRESKHGSDHSKP